MSLRKPDQDNARESRRVAARDHRLRHRVAVGFTVVLTVLVVLVGAGVGYTAIQNRRLRRINGLNQAKGGQDAPVAKVVKGEPVNILVVGSDSRAFASSSADKKKFGTSADVTGQRSDTMMVIRLDPKNDHATIMSIARDLNVDFEGGGRGRINEAFAEKGDPNKSDPARLIRTIRSNFGVTVNHYIEIDFAGFRQVVDAIGGVNVYFPYPARDAFSNLSIDKTGCVQLDGPQALSYVRARHYEFKGPKGWQFDGTSDIGRIQRQQDFIRRVLRKAVTDGLTNPVKAAKLIEAGIGNVTVDGGFSLGDMKSLASQLRDLNESKVAFVALTGDPTTIDGSDVLKLNPGTADEILAPFGATLPGTTRTTPRGTTPTVAIPAGGTAVVLYNGTGRPSLVAQVQSDLDRLGVRATSGGNSRPAATTQIRYKPGTETAAKAVSTYLGDQSTLTPDNTVKSGEVIVLLGRTFDHVIAPQSPAAATGTTLTTLPPATPTTKPPSGSDPSVAC